MSETKLTPTETPQLEEALADRLKRATKDKALARDFRILLEVGGGVSSQSYSLAFEATGGGSARAHFEDELTGRKGRGATKRMDERRFARLLEAIRASGVLRLQPEGPPFLPDTLVGRLLISHGERQRLYYFVADEDQADAQNRRIPAPLAKAVDVVYAEAARLMRTRSVKP